MGVVAIIYSIIAYIVFFAAFLYLIPFMGAEMTAFLGVPKTLDAGPSPAAGAPAALVNIALLILFGVQHSVMARGGFKKALTKIVPPAMERSTYVLATVAVLIALYVFWIPMPATVWRIEAPVWKELMIGLYFAGLGLVLLSTFLINHFELFGLLQGWLHLRKKPAAAPKFRTPALYKSVRHPLYLGWLIAFWATPHLTAGHLLFAAIWSLYIFVAIGYEERDLIAVFGDKYREYMEKTPSIIPIGRRK